MADQADRAERERDAVVTADHDADASGQRPHGRALGRRWRPRRPRPRRVGEPGPTWRFAGAAVAAILLVSVIYVAFVLTSTGQRLENLALAGAALHDPEDIERSLTNLSQISLVSFGLAIVVVFGIALIRRRVFLGALAAAVMIGSAVGTELLKGMLVRPELVAAPAWLLRNSFPSGHATVAAAIGVGLLLVTPDRLRWLLVPAAAIYASIIGQSTQIAGWHRLSGAIGGVLVAVAIGSIALGVLATAGLVQRSESGRVHPRLRAVLQVAGAASVLLGVAIAIMPVAFPLFQAPAGAVAAFVHTSFDLLGIGFTMLAIVGFAALIEPYSLGRQAEAHRHIGQATDDGRRPHAEPPERDNRVTPSDP